MRQNTSAYYRTGYMIIFTHSIVQLQRSMRHDVTLPEVSRFHLRQPSGRNKAPPRRCRQNICRHHGAERESENGMKEYLHLHYQCMRDRDTKACCGSKQAGHYMHKFIRFEITTWNVDNPLSSLQFGEGKKQGYNCLPYGCP